MAETSYEFVKIPYGEGEGETIKYVKYKKQGVMMFPGITTADLDGIRDLHIRDDDVIQCAFPRSGNHWTWEWVRMLMWNRTEIDRYDKDIAIFDIRTPKELDNLPSPRVFHSHLHVKHFPKEFLQKKTKLIVTYRNPKDVCVSWYMHHIDVWQYGYKGEFKNWQKPFLEGNVDWGAYSDYLRQLEEFMEQHPDHPVLVLRYEQMVKEPLRQITRLAKFLGKNCDQNYLQTVVDATSFTNMREVKGKAWKETWNIPIPNDHNTIYRKGVVGDWKNWFTVAQSEEFDRQWAKATKGLKVFKFV